MSRGNRDFGLAASPIRASIFVLVSHQSYEGHSAPVQAFLTAEAARAALALAKGASHGEGWRIYAVPVSPKPADFDLRPVQWETVLLGAEKNE